MIKHVGAHAGTEPSRHFLYRYGTVPPDREAGTPVPTGLMLRTILLSLCSFLGARAPRKLEDDFERARVHRNIHAPANVV